MSTWAGIIVRPSAEVCDALRTARVELTPGEGFAVVAIRGGLGLLADANRLAADVARASGTEVIALFMQSAVDAYAVEEHGPDGTLRRLVYAREGGGWQTIEGPVRPWEADLHFRGEREEFLADLEAEELTTAELAAAAAAWDARSVEALPRLPPMSQRAFSSFVERYGETRAVADRRGLIARLLRFG